MATSLTALPHEGQGGSMGGCEKEFWIYLNPIPSPGRWQMETSDFLLVLR